MAHRFEKGKHIFLLFKRGYTVQDSQLKPRYYLDRKKAEKYLPYGEEIVEYAPVVLCKDCKHYVKNLAIDRMCCYVHLLSPHAMREDDFCSYGERRTDND